MARAPKATKAVAAAYSPPATRTRSKGKDKDRPAPTAAADISSSDIINNTKPAAPAKPATKARSKRQPAVDRNAQTKVTKPRARKPTNKKAAPSKNSVEQHIEHEVEKQVEQPKVKTPSRAPARRTRAATKAGYASPLAPVSDDLNVVTRQAKSKKIPKNATPLSIIDDDAAPADPDDWFGDLAVKSPVYDPRAMEVSDHDENPANDTASSDVEEPMSGDVDLVGDIDLAVEAENGSDTEKDSDDGELERPMTPEEPAQDSEPEAPTTFGIRRVFSSVFSVGKRLFGTPRDVPNAPDSPVSSPLASPSSAAQHRRARKRDTPVRPREKNADKRHAMAEEQKTLAELEKEELLELVRKQQEQLQEWKRQQEEQESQHETGQKRRRLSMEIIPARRPGEKGSFGIVDEYFYEPTYDQPDWAPGSMSTVKKPPRSRARNARNSLPETRASKRLRTASPVQHEDDTDDEYEFAAGCPADSPTTLKRPRNGYRQVVMKDGGEDPLVVNQQHRIMHHENSFSRDPLRDGHSTGNKLSSPKNPSPSTVYNGSLIAMPGDPGYKPENVFKKSQEQNSPKRRKTKDGRMDSEELKARAEAIVKKMSEGRDVTDEEEELLERAQRKFGHIAGTGSFSAPEWDSDDDSTITDFSDEPKSPERISPAKNRTTPKSKSPVKATTGKQDSMKPPPPPVPAHAQLPGTPSPPVNGTPSKTAATPTTVPKTPAPKESGQSASPFQTAALARQRELAEKHKPKMGSRLQYVSRASSSPTQQQNSDDAELNPMSQSLITQGISAPIDSLVSVAVDIEMEKEEFARLDALLEAKIAERQTTSIYETLNEDEKKYLAYLDSTQSPEELEAERAAIFKELDRKVELLLESHA